MKPHVVLILLLASCGTVRNESLSGDRNTPDAGVLALPPAREALHLVPGEKKKALTCQDLLTELGRVTGVTFSADSEVRTALARTNLGITGDLDVPAENAWALAESLLVARGFLFEVLSRDPFLVDVLSSQPLARGSAPRTRAGFVPYESLSTWADHPGFLIRTTVDLPALNTRDLSNSMRQMFTDPQTQQIIPLGNTQTLMLCGTGSQVADVADMLLRLDRAERERCDRLGVVPDVGVARQPQAK